MEPRRRRADVTPRSGLRKDTRFTVVVRYDGVPETLEDLFGFSGSSTPTMGRSSSANRTSQRHGSRPTTIQG